MGVGATTLVFNNKNELLLEVIQANDLELITVCLVKSIILNIQIKMN